MARFLKKVSFFIIVAAILFWLMLYGTSSFISKGNYFDVPKNISSLVLGHSQSASSINDILLDKFYNLSQNTEGYPYSYFKAKMILENNTQIENIFLEYTNNQIDDFAKNRVYGIYLDVNVPKNLPVLESNFTAKILWKNKNPIKITKTLSQALISNVNFILGENPNYIESKWHYYEVSKKIYDPDVEVPKSFFENKFIKFKTKVKEIEFLKPLFNSEKNDPVQSDNFKYLKMLTELCNDNNVNIYFIRSPLPFSTTSANEDKFLEILNNEFENVIFLDFKEFPLQNNKFADHMHLNESGRKEFTLFFKKLISEGVLHKSNPQGLIDSEMVDYQSNERL